jgi:hypothetical protein
LIGDAGFGSFKKLVAAITKELATARKGSSAKATPVPAAVLPAKKDQQDAVAFDAAKLSDPRSVRIVQGVVGAKPTGTWDAESVRHVALKQQALGRTADGKIDEGTLEGIASELIASFEQDDVVQLIVDYFDFDRTHAFTLMFDPSFAPSTPGGPGDAETLRPFPGFGTGSIVKFGPDVFTKPFPGIVHTIAHELGHVDQTMQGIQSNEVREFLSESIEIVSAGMPTESIESLADIDAIAANKPPATPGFLLDASAALGHWLRMTRAEQHAHTARFVQVRNIVVSRIAAEASPDQKRRLQPFVRRWQAAQDGSLP